MARRARASAPPPDRRDAGVQHDLAVAQLTPRGRAVLLDPHASHRSPPRSPGGATVPNAPSLPSLLFRRLPDATRRSHAQGLLAAALARRALLPGAEPALALRRRPHGDRVLGRSRRPYAQCCRPASSRTRPTPAARRRSSPTGRAAPTAAASCSTRRAASTWSSSSSSTRCWATRRSRPARTSGWTVTSRSCAAGSRAFPRSSARSG